MSTFASVLELRDLDSNPLDGEWADFIYRPANGPKDFESDVLAKY